LDQIAKGDKIWHNLCRECLTDIDECSKDLDDGTKQIIKIDENHVYMIGKYGPVIKRGDKENAVFLNVKKDINLEKLKKGEYTLDEIVESKLINHVIGKYNGDDVILKKGKFGNYIMWGENRKSLNNIEKLFGDKSVDELTIEEVIQYIESSPVASSSSVVRDINENTSIRKGKFGNYIFYKIHNMSTPKFIKLNKFKGNYNSCPINEIETYVLQNM
jgi:DNA topoisomerase I